MPSSMIVAPQPDAVEAGAIAFKDGGNAVDAALTCALAQTVVDPLMCGIAGFGSMHLYLPARGYHGLIDFHARSPAATRPEMWQDLIEGEAPDGFGFILKGRVNDLGYQSIATPGTIKAFQEAHRRFGRLAWSRILEPAIALARDGYALAPEVYHYFVGRDAPGRVSVLERLLFSPSGRRIYGEPSGQPGGQPRAIGSLIRNPDMAATLERIATAGAEDLYEGEIARRIAADMAANGALLTAADLQAYRTNETEPLRGRYRGLEVATNRPPGGGIMVIEMLNILERFDLAALGHNSPEYIRIVAEAMKIATADKDAHVGDPAFVEVPTDRLTDKGYAAGRARAIEAGTRHAVPRLGLPEPQRTTHISALDRDGNAVSMTHSLGMMSGVITDGMGFMYNGCMAVFDPRPGRPGSLAPGKARFSSICPTMLLSGGEPLLILGAPGGTQIAMGVLQVILNVVDFAMPVADAVRAPRFSATSDLIDVCARIPRYAYAPLEALGYGFRRSPYSYDFAAVQAIEIRDGRPSGGADVLYGAGMALEV